MNGQARHHLHLLIVEILRAVARGDDLQGRVTRELVAFIECAGKTQTPLPTIVDDVITELHKDIVPQRDVPDYQDEIEDIVLASLRVAAEACCHDPAASARRLQREHILKSRVESYIIGCERRAREHERSYVRSLIRDQLPPETKPRWPKR